MSAVKDVARRPVCASAPNAAIERLWQHTYAVRRSVGTGTIVGHATTRQAALFVVAGALVLEEARAAEESRMLEIVGPGAPPLVPGAFGFDDSRFVVRAVMPTTFVRLPLEVLCSEFRNNPELAIAISERLFERLAAHREWVAAAGSASVQRRVANSLLRLINNVGSACVRAPCVRLLVSQTIISALADLSRQTTNTVLREFQELGYLRLERRMVCVLDGDAIREIAEGRQPSTAWCPAGPCRMMMPTQPLTCWPLRRAGREA